MTKKYTQKPRFPITQFTRIYGHCECCLHELREAFDEVNATPFLGEQEKLEVMRMTDAICRIQKRINELSEAANIRWERQLEEEMNA